MGLQRATKPGAEAFGSHRLEVRTFVNVFVRHNWLEHESQNVARADHIVGCLFLHYALEQRQILVSVSASAVDLHNVYTLECVHCRPIERLDLCIANGPRITAGSEEHNSGGSRSCCS